MSISTTELTDQQSKRFTVLARDITERKQMTEALKTSEERYRTLVETMYDGLGVQDENGIITYANDSLCRMWGYSRDELIGQPTTAFLDEANRTVFEQNIAERREGGSQNYEVEWTGQHARKIVTLVSPSPLFDNEGNFKGSFAVMTDITYRKRTEEALQRKEELAQRYLNIAATIIVAIDADGRITLINETGCQLLKRSKSDLIGKDWFATCLPEYLRNDLRAVFRRLIAEEIESAKINENPILTSDGNERLISWHNTILRDEAGNIIGTLSSGSDVTELKAAENKLRRHERQLEGLVAERTHQIRELERQRAESDKLVATGYMAARIAHEVNNPLAGLKNAFLLIADAIPADHPDRDLVGLIHEQIDRISNIVRQMFSIYNPDVGTPQQIDVAPMIQGVVKLLEPLCRQHDVTIRLGTVVPLGSFFSIQGYLVQIIFNLLTNAIHASPEGGTVEISVDRKDEKIVIEVADNGQGIPEDVQKRLFDPFFTTRSSSEGSSLGLGLTVSRSYAQAMGGQLTFENRACGGAVFRLILPHHEVSDD